MSIHTNTLMGSYNWYQSQVFGSLKGKKPNLQYFRVFGSLCYPTNDYEYLQMLTMQDVMTHGEVLRVQLNFLDIGLLAGHPKSRKVRPSPLQKLNTSPYLDAVLKSSGCALNCETMDLRSIKFR
ncbi:hypothetical protein Tco_0603754, partial [Tanacetum coccineum]